MYCSFLNIPHIRIINYIKNIKKFNSLNKYIFNRFCCFSFILIHKKLLLKTIDDIKPNKENIQNGSYTLSTTFYAVTTKNAMDNNPNIKELIDFILFK